MSSLLQSVCPEVVARHVLRSVSLSCKLSVGVLRGASRFPRLVLPRQALWALLREYTPLSLPEIGRLTCRHHTTVLLGIRAHVARLVSDPEYAHSFEIVRRAVVRRLERL